MVHRQSKDGDRKNGGLFWQRVLAAHSVSGLTVWRFYYWRRKLREAVPSAPTDPVRFFPIEIRQQFDI